jgi:hypothetical protein
VKRGLITRFSRLGFSDSAEKPPLVKKRQLKTPPKYEALLEIAAHIESWSENFRPIFAVNS